MNFEYWFPTITAFHFVSSETKNTTKNKIEKWIETYEYSNYIELCKEDNLTTSYFKRNDILNDIDLQELRSEIIDCSLLYANHLGLNLKITEIRIDSWVNFFYPNQSEQQHNHYGNFISGVYYINIPENSGVYRFYDPAPQKIMWNGAYLNLANKNVSNQTSGTYIPEEGKMIIFPSWLEHCVMTNKSNQIRISLAFNVNMVK